MEIDDPDAAFDDERNLFTSDLINHNKGDTVNKQHTSSHSHLYTVAMFYYITTQVTQSNHITLLCTVAV